MPDESKFYTTGPETSKFFGKLLPSGVYETPPNPPPSSVWDGQISGSHYKDFKIQPAEFIQDNKLDWCEGNIVKYICRHHQKNKEKDVEKVMHYSTMILEKEYGYTKEKVLELIEELYGEEILRS